MITVDDKTYKWLEKKQMKNYESWDKFKKERMKDWKFRIWWWLTTPAYWIDRWKIMRSIRRDNDKGVN